MKRILTISFFILCLTAALQSKPVLSASKQYLIATLNDNATGTVSLGNADYPLIYNTDRDEENAQPTDYWIIKNISDNQYTFQNASTGKYIQYNSAAVSERSALALVDGLQTDNSTSFTLELKLTNGLCYYIIRSVVNSNKMWDRRATAYNSVYPVGVYSGSGGNNELFVFYDSSGKPVVDETPVGLPTANRTLGSLSSYLSSLTFDSKTPIVDKENKELYLSVTEASINTNVTKTIKSTPKNSAYKLYINNQLVETNTTYSFNKVNASTGYLIEIKNGTTKLTTATLYFSCLPLVQLYSDGTIGTVYSMGRVAVTEPEKTDTTEVVLTNIKTRGASSLYYDKKSFALNIRNSVGNDSDDRTFFSLRNDNNWILDAMFIDPSRMRNRVSTDLWNSFSTKPYWFSGEPEAVNGTRGRFVEVFINDIYHGLYCMTEKIDRKQLKLKKLKSTTGTNNQITYTQRGTSFKATGWSNAVFMGYPYGGKIYSMYNNNSITWSGYECKYPELDEGEPIMWDNLYKAALIPNDYYTTNANFTAKVTETFDLPVYLDYYLFIELMLATDNHGKNTYTSIYDQTASTKVSITPWDLDGVFGIRWDSSKDITGPEQNFDTFVINNEHGQFNLFQRLKELDVNNWKTLQLKNRYLSLRGKAFSYDSLMNRFQKYADLFALSGADTREINKWGQYGVVTNISSEMSYISDWLTKRLAYLDIQYLGKPYTAVNDVKSDINIICGPNPVTDILNITGLQLGATVSIYTLQGVMLESRKADNTTLHINMSRYPAGIYIVRSGSYSEKIIRK
ncbi:MAG: CotH kinase family protein [Paludibacteraceae bacterium]